MAPWKLGPNPHNIPAVKGARLGVLLGMTALLPFAATACGDDNASSATLAPIQTTSSTSSTVFVTTTTVQAFYVIKRGDTLGKIAKAFQVRLADLMSLNGIANADDIQAGQELRIPTGAVVYDTLPTPVTTPSTT
jgi:LysM repeat protein